MRNGQSITGDWQIDRLIKHRSLRFVQAAPGSLLVGRNTQRVAITLVENDIPIGMTFGAVSDGVAIPIFSATDSLKWFHLTLLEYGDLVQREWRLIENLNTNIAFVIEYFLPENVLTMQLESLHVG